MCLLFIVLMSAIIICVLLNKKDQFFATKLLVILHSSARVLVEIAFGDLKARSCRSTKQIDRHISNIPNVIVACCVLHSICKVQQDSFNDNWKQELKPSWINL